MPHCLSQWRQRPQVDALRDLPFAADPFLKQAVRYHRFRLAIDRAFTVKGLGEMGTALSGEVNVGDTLWLNGVNKPMMRASRAKPAGGTAQPAAYRPGVIAAMPKKTSLTARLAAGRRAAGSLNDHRFNSRPTRR